MPTSLPALAAGILQSHKMTRCRSDAARFADAPLVPAYRVEDDLPVAEQPAQVAQAIAELAQKLGRLEEAYTKWPVFEAGPYFDLYPTHATRFCRLEQTQHAVRLRLYGDLLAPAFRAAERFWVQGFLPAYVASRNGIGSQGAAGQRANDAAARLAVLLAQAEGVIQDTLDLLGDDLQVLACLGGLEERIQHRPHPGAAIAPGLAPALQRLPREMPTLTLDIMFARPEERSPGYDQWQRHTGQRAIRRTW